MSHILSLITNVKGPTRSIELGSKTLILGDNASGKSAIAQSVELVLTGAVTNEAGKAFSQGLNLMSLHADGVGELEIIGVWSDNKRSSFELEGSEAKASRAKHVERLTATLPFTEWKQTMNKEADSVRLTLLHCLSGVVSISVPPIFKGVCSGVSKITSIAELTNLVNVTDTRIRSARKTHKEMLAVVEATENVAGMDIDTLESEYQALNTAFPVGVQTLSPITPETLSLLKPRPRCETCLQPLPEPTTTHIGVLTVENITTSSLFENKIRAEALKEQITRLQDRMNAENTTLELDTQIAQLKQFETWLSGCMKKLLAKCESTFTERLHLFTKPLIPRLLLEVDDKPVLKIGFQKGERFTSVVSGAEWCILLMALSTLTGSADSYIIPEDKGWDSKTLAGVLDNFGNAVQNVLITSTVEPASIPSGWTVIRV